MHCSTQEAVVQLNVQSCFEVKAVKKTRHSQGDESVILRVTAAEVMKCLTNYQQVLSSAVLNGMSYNWQTPVIKSFSLVAGEQQVLKIMWF